MIHNSENIHSLIAKQLTDKIAEVELSELEKWKNASNDNLNEYNDIIDLWAKTNSLKLPGILDESNALKLVKSKAGLKSGRQRAITLFVQAAAVLLLSLLFSGVYSYWFAGGNEKFGQVKSSKTIYQEIRAAYGTQSKIELADGTTVYLNSGSTLRFPQSFESMEQRNVFLDGEAFFSVTKNKSHPFVVQTQQLAVKVLGTTFNVNAYSDNKIVDVALVEGSVLLEHGSGNVKKEEMNLSPNQVAVLDVNKNLLTKSEAVDLYKYTAWINGRIVFFGDPIQTVVKRLEKWYNVEIEISDKKLENYRFTGTFIDESLEQILHVLSLTSPMTYEIQAAYKRADNSLSRRKIILRDKNNN
jgi:ferric-dicitrate binding protein FerR (iron transport regulator)